MKLLHTSDWHVGRTMRGMSRAEEHESVLSEIAGIAAAEEVDVVLVVGDLFDTAAPSPEAERIVYRALLDLSATGATVVVVSGNHDNERRLQAVEPLLGLGRIVTRASFARPEAGGVVEVTSRRGERAVIALLPFLSQRYVVKVDDLMEREAGEHILQYGDRVRRILDTLTAGFRPDAVNVVAAHLMVTGGMAGGGERAAHTIFEYCVPPQAFPASTHYVALGHLHRPQRVGGPCPIWYCGSPLQLDFGESDDHKCVLLVEASPETPAEVRPVRLRSGRRLRTLRGTLEELRALSGTTGDDYLRVFVRDHARAGLAEEVREMLPLAVDVRVDPPAGPDVASAQPRTGRAPRELFADYLAEARATDHRVLALFDRLYDEAHATDPA